MSDRSRAITARTLAVLASLVLVLAMIAGYVRHAAIDSEQFANRATAALKDDSVRGLLAEKLTDGVVLERESDLLAARPLIESVTAEVIGSRAFTGLYRRAVGDVHRAVFDRDRDTVTLTVADVGTVVAAALQKLRPALARKVENTGRIPVLRRDLGSVGGDAARIGDKVRVLSLLLWLALLVLVVAAVAISRDRRRTFVELGLGAAAAGVVVVVAYGIVRSQAVGRIETPEGRAAAGGVWDAFLEDLRSAGWIVAGAGAVVAATASSLIKPVDIREPLARLGRAIATEPERPALRVVRGILLLAAGLLVVFDRDAVVALLLTLLGVYLIYEGASAIMRLIYRPPAEREPRKPVASHRRLAGVLVATGVVVAAGSIFIGSGGATTPPPSGGPCNGHEELCDRPFDRVVLPATHNSMAVPLPGWFAPEQEKPIADQLADGVRGLLLDTHYADRLPNGKLRTDLATSDKFSSKADGVSPEAVASAKRIRERLGFSGKGTRGMYLCHSFCELGATPLADALDDIHDFLVSHPDEVIAIVNEDYVTPADFVAAARKAGLADMAFAPPAGGGEWPTLRQLVDRNQRVLVLAENEAGEAPWYQLAYKHLTQETPYSFRRVEDFTDPKGQAATCRANRGTATAPLFLINHWISTDPVPLPSNAAKVNAYAPLLRRARECSGMRKRTANLLAVNFYREGDLFPVVDALNGVR